MPETPSDSPIDRLWREYAQTFRDFDDLTLARWCSQTLSQLRGRVWRSSHPLVGAYRLAAQQAEHRQIWLKRLVGMPVGYVEAPCCRAPLLPLFTREVVQNGFICQHCSETCIHFDDLQAAFQERLKTWAAAYDPVHQVAHWDDRQRKKAKDYDTAFEDAAQQAEKLLAEAAQTLVPTLLDIYPAAVWEDHDDCLEVRPEDIEL
jgi:hypothetical protein